MSLQISTSHAAIVRRVCGLVSRVEERGRRAGGKLLSLPSDLVEDLKDAAVRISQECSCDKVPDLLVQIERQRPEFWLQALVIHGWALRDMAALQRNLSERSVEWSKLCGIVCVLPRLLHASAALVPPSKHSRRLMYAILRSDLLACYAAVLAAITHVPHWELNDCIDMFRLLAVVMSQIGHVASGRSTDGGSCVVAVPVSNIPFAPALYRDWLTALSRSNVLEHTARALLRLEASTRAALEQGNCSANMVRDKLSEIGFHLTGVVNCTTQPHLRSPILSLSPRPLATPDEDNRGIRVTLKPLRKLLSGTCLQFWLGKHLLEARLMLTEGVGSTHGLPPSVLLPASLKPSHGFAPAAIAPHLQLTINMCTTVWQITVSGPRPPTPQVALGRDIPPNYSTSAVLVAASLPYSAVNVYDMSAEAVWCVAQRVVELNATGRADHISLANTLRLLVRLVSELEPDDAEQRLPQLWRSFANLMPFVCVGNPGLSTAVCRMTLTLLQMLTASERGPPDERRRASGAAAAHAGEDDPWVCTRSLSCALKAGFLPALEHAFRRLASQRPPAGSECVIMLNAVLRISGVWPALLAHGSAKEVASLIATLGKVARALREWPHSANRTTTGSSGSSLAATDAAAAAVVAAASDVANQFAVQLLALMEQAAAFVLQPWNLPAPPPPPPRKAGGKGGKGGSSSSRHQGRAAAGGGSGVAGGAAAALAAAKRKLLELNNSMDHCKANHITLEWLVFTGGQPPPDAPPLEQQRTMAVFAMVQWLPLVASLLTPTGVGVHSWWTAEVGRLLTRGSLLVALQCLKSREAATTVAALMSLMGEYDASAQNDNTHHQRHLCWRDFLLNRLGVMGWLARVFSLPDRVVRDYPDLIPGALDILEVLAVALPYDVVRHVTLVAASPAAGGAPSTPKKGAAAVKDRGGKSAGSSTPAASDGFELSSATVVLSEAFLLRYGRKSLRAALQELHITVLEETAAILRGGIGRVGEMLTTVVELQELRSELDTKHDLERLPPPLPAPTEAERAAGALGVKRCANARCNALDGAPQESEVGWKRCSRCKAVNYCCLGCQREHWETGHRRECGSGGAATSG